MSLLDKLEDKKPSEDDIISNIFTLPEIIDLLTVYSVNHYDLDLSGLLGRHIYGFIDFNNRTINIYKKQSIGEMRSTLIHEFIHALKEKYGIKDYEKRTIKQEKMIFNMLYNKTNYIKR